jgi:hypothetical protein
MTHLDLVKPFETKHFRDMECDINFSKLNWSRNQVIEQFRYRISLHVTGDFYPFAFLSGCPWGFSLVLAGYPRRGFYVSCITTRYPHRSHVSAPRALCVRLPCLLLTPVLGLTSLGRPLAYELMKHGAEYSAVCLKLLRTVSQFLNLVPTIDQQDSRALLLCFTTQSAGGSLNVHV